MGKVDPKRKELEIVKELQDGIIERQEAFTKALLAGDALKMYDVYTKEALAHMKVLPDLVSDPVNRMHLVESTMDCSMTVEMELAKMEAVRKYLECQG